MALCRTGNKFCSEPLWTVRISAVMLTLHDYCMCSAGPLLAVQIVAAFWDWSLITGKGAIPSKQFHVVTTLSQHDLFVVATLQSYVAATKICGLPDWL